MHPIRFVTALLLTASLAACASTPDTPYALPDYSPIAGDIVPPQGRLIIDCIDAATSAGTYDRVQNDDTRMIRFSCSGPVARAFYDGLAEHSAALGSQFEFGGQVYRSTEKVERDLFAVDHCVIDHTGSAHCVVNLNIGSFLASVPQ